MSDLIKYLNRRLDEKEQFIEEVMSEQELLLKAKRIVRIVEDGLISEYFDDDLERRLRDELQ